MAARALSPKMSFVVSSSATAASCCASPSSARYGLLRTFLDHKRLKSSAEVQTNAFPDRAAAADATELRITLLEALGHLTPRDRAIVVLRYWEEQSVQSVAELLGLSPGVVKMQSVRALATLRVLPGDDDVVPAPPA